MSALLERISAADDMEEHEVDVPEWGVEILLITPSMATRSRLMEAQIAARRDIPESEGMDDATAALRRIDMNQMQFSVIQACAFDPADRNQLFLAENTDADLAMLGAKNGKVVWQLFEACQLLAGLAGSDDDDVVDEGKDG